MRSLRPTIFTWVCFTVFTLVGNTPAPTHIFLNPVNPGIFNTPRDYHWGWLYLSKILHCFAVCAMYLKLYFLGFTIYHRNFSLENPKDDFIQPLPGLHHSGMPQYLCIQSFYHCAGCYICRCFCDMLYIG